MRLHQGIYTVLIAGFVVAGCGEPKPLQFGAVLPLTGESALYGQSIRKGIELAYSEIQAREGIPPVELTIKDSQSDPQRAREVLDELYGNGILAVIGGVTTDEALEMVSVMDRYERVLLSPSASNPQLTGISANFYRVFPSDFLEGTKMGNFATQTLNLKSVVILAAESPYAKGVQEIFKNEFERYGGEVLEVIEYPPNTSDFSGLVERVLTLKPDAVYLADYAEQVKNMIQGLRRRNYRGVILTTSAFSSPEIIAATGRAAEEVLLTQAVFEVESEEPHIRHFVDAYRERYGEEPDLYAAHGYDAMMILMKAVEEGGRTPSDFWKGMRSIRNFPGVTGTLQFDEKGDVQKFPRVYAVKDGSLINYEAYLAARREELRRRLEELNRERRALERQGKS